MLGSLSHRALLAIAAIVRPAPTSTTDQRFIDRALAMRDQAVADGDQAYGAIMVKDYAIAAEMPSRVVVNNDPTAHAEMETIRAAAKVLGRDLVGCTMISSSKPCSMCEAAAYWAGVERLVYGSNGTDGGPPKLC